MCASVCEEPTRDDGDDNIENIHYIKSWTFFPQSMFVTFFFSIGNSYGMIDEDSSNVEDNTVCCLGLIESKIWHFLFEFRLIFRRF